MAVQYHSRCVSYWLKIVKLPPSRLPKACYIMLRDLDIAGRQTWATSVQKLLCRYGFNHVWAQQGVGNEELFLNIFKLRVSENCRSEWVNNIKNSSKLATYSLFKYDLLCEGYLNVLSVRKYLAALSRFRCSCHSLAVETGRHSKVLMADRICILCQDEHIVLEDEYHFLFGCNTYCELREKYLARHISTPYSYQQFIDLMSSGEKKVIEDLACYIYHAFKLRSDMLKTGSA